MPTLWVIYGLLWLRCGSYGGSMGCCGCGTDPMGNLWAAVAAVWDLWGICGLLWLQCGTYGIDLWTLWESMGCCGCGVGPMGDLWAAVAAVWAYGNLL